MVLTKSKVGSGDEIVDVIEGIFMGKGHSDLAGKGAWRRKQILQRLASLCLSTECLPMGKV